MREYINAYHPTSGLSEYPFAPSDWSEKEAIRAARKEGLELTEQHLEVIRALQAHYFAHEREGVTTRGLHETLHERFHKKGGLRYLYVLFPLGPTIQGCRLAGLALPVGAEKRASNSIQ